MGWTFYNSSGQKLSSAASIPAEATQSDLEDEGTSNANRYVSPEVQKYHPGNVKAWARWEMSGAHGLTVSKDYTSVTDAGLGITNHVISPGFSSANWVCVFGGVDAPAMYLGGGGHTATTFTSIVENAQDGTRLDSTAATVALLGTYA